MNELFRDRVHFVTPFGQKLIYGVYGDKNGDFVRIKSRSPEVYWPNYLPLLESWPCINFRLGLRGQDAHFGAE